MKRSFISWVCILAIGSASALIRTSQAAKRKSSHSELTQSLSKIPFKTTEQQTAASIGALIAFHNPTKTSRGNPANCTGFLIGPNLFATSSHCIPEDLKTAGSKCADRIWILFSETQEHQKEIAICDRVITATKTITINSTEQSYLPDYAFLQLKENTKRPTLKFSRLGLKHKQHVSVLKVTETGSKKDIEFSLKSISCTAMQNTKLMPSFNRTSSPIATLINCPVEAGASGSPVMDSNSEVRAIVTAQILNPNNTTTSKQIALATNSNCIAGASEDDSFVPGPHCEIKSALNPTAINDLVEPDSKNEDTLSDETAVEMEQHKNFKISRGSSKNRDHKNFALWSAMRADHNSFEQFSIPNGDYLFFVPKCLFREQSWSPAFRKAAHPNSPRETQVIYTAPLLGKVVTDKETDQMSVQYIPTNYELILGVLYSTEELERLGRAKTKIVIVDTNTGIGHLLEQPTLPLCVKNTPPL